MTHNRFTQPEAQEVYDFIVSHEVLSFDLQNKMQTILHNEMPEVIKTGEEGTPMIWYHAYFGDKSDEQVKEWIVRHSEEGVKL